MGDIFEKLDAIKNSKAGMQEAIASKGSDISEATLLSEYAQKIVDITGGEKDIVEIVGNYTFPDFQTTEEPVGGKIYVIPPGAKAPEIWSGTIYNDLQEAMSASVAGNFIYVLKGTYFLTSNITPKKGVSVYGGFDETGLWENRNPFVSMSIFDSNYQPYGYLISSAAATDYIVLDGIVFTRYKNTASNGNIHIGVSLNAIVKNCLIMECSPSKTAFHIPFTGSTIENCIAINCSGSGFISGGSISNCVAINCKGSQAGGFYINNSTSIITNCVAINCECPDSYGGGFTLYGCTANGCSAIGCKGSGSGFTTGGFYATLYQNVYTVLNNCVAINCKARTGSAAGFYINYSTANSCKAINCSQGGGFVGWYNSTLNACSAINNSYSDGFIIRNSIKVVNCFAVNCEYVIGPDEGGLIMGGGFNFQGGSNTLIMNNAAVNCKSATNTERSSGGFTISGPATFHNNVAFNCYLSGILKPYQIEAVSTNYKIKFYNNAGDAEPIFYNNSASYTDVQNYKLLTQFPFSEEARDPMDIVGALDFEVSSSNNMNNIVVPIQKTIVDNIVNLHITSDSVLAGAGYYESGLTPETDLDGKTRPNPPSIGPFEP